MTSGYKYGVPYLLPDGRINSEWSHKYYLAHRDSIRERSHAYYLANKEKMIALSREWHFSHKARSLKRQREHSLEMKRQAVLKTNGTLACAIEGCGCDDLTILQANYVSGGHTTLVRERKLPSGGLALYREIAYGRVEARLFNFLCPPHNAIDHLAKIRNKFRIHWKG